MNLLKWKQTNMGTASVISSCKQVIYPLKWQSQSLSPKLFHYKSVNCKDISSASSWNPWTAFYLATHWDGLVGFLKRPEVARLPVNWCQDDFQLFSFPVVSGSVWFQSRFVSEQWVKAAPLLLLEAVAPVVLCCVVLCCVVGWLAPWRRPHFHGGSCKVCLLL